MSTCHFDKTTSKPVQLFLTYKQVRMLHELIRELLDEDVTVFKRSEQRFYKALAEELEGL